MMRVSLARSTAIIFMSLWIGVIDDKIGIHVFPAYVIFIKYLVSRCDVPQKTISRPPIWNNNER